MNCFRCDKTAKLIRDNKGIREDMRVYYGVRDIPVAEVYVCLDCDLGMIYIDGRLHGLGRATSSAYECVIPEGCLAVIDE